MRLHFWHAGTPLAIDEIYATTEPILLSSFKRRYKPKEDIEEKPLINRLTLHATQLTILQKTYEAQLQKDFEITIKQLKKYYR
jgi:23S rRNA pseudouridine955/2504/2580 synthase/23S rRNA pseudouridine1911/1915/1917 synthase